MNEEQKLAEYVLNHPGTEKVLDRLNAKYFKAFMKGTLAEREEISRMADSLNFFLQELKAIANESIDINQPEDEDNEK